MEDQSTAIAISPLLITLASTLLSILSTIIIVVVKDTSFKTRIETQLENLKESVKADRTRFIQEFNDLKTHTVKHAEAITSLRGDQQWAKEFAQRQNDEIASINKTLNHLNEGITKLEATLEAFVKNMENGVSQKFNRRN